jgi:hypothetical protein
MTDTLIPLTTEMSGEELEQLDLFRYKFRELWDNWESLKAQGISLGGYFSNLGGGKVDGPGCGIEVHRLKGFYLDFRFFYAQKEPTHFYKVTSMLGKHCEDQRLYACLKSNKEQWVEAGLLHEWHGVKPDEMIDVLFNGDLFHTVPEKRERMHEIQTMMHNDLAHHCLVYSVYLRMLAIRNINWVIKPLIGRSQRVRIPAEFAQQHHPADACTSRG